MWCLSITAAWPGANFRQDFVDGKRDLKPGPGRHYLQRWQVSKRVNSSKADADDTKLIERLELATA